MTSGVGVTSVLRKDCVLRDAVCVLAGAGGGSVQFQVPPMWKVKKDANTRGRVFFPPIFNICIYIY